MTLTPLPAIRAALRTAQGMETLKPILADLRAVLDANAGNPQDVATTIYNAQGAAADYYQPLDPETEKHVMQWIRANWSSEPFAYLDLLSAILVNTFSDDARMLLEEKLAIETEPRCKNMLQVRLKDRNDHIKKAEDFEAEE
jgi:hypothetical protein